VFKNNCVGHLIGKKGSFVKNLRDNFGVSIKFYQDRHNTSLEKDEYIAVRTFILLTLKIL